MDFMKRHGETIMKMAGILFAVNLIASVVTMIVLAKSIGVGGFFLGLFCIPISYSNYLLTYGFGKLVDNSDKAVFEIIQLNSNTDALVEQLKMIRESSNSDGKQDSGE